MSFLSQTNLVPANMKVIADKRKSVSKRADDYLHGIYKAVGQQF